MATAVEVLRRNIGDEGDPPAWSDEELAGLLADAGGSEPRARIAALLPLQAEAAGRVGYAVGSAREDASDAFDQLTKLIAQAGREAAAGDAADRAATEARAATGVAVPVQYVY